MKSSIHLLYGIIIGILLAACTGQTTSETSTPTSSIAEQKQFEEIREEKFFLVDESNLKNEIRSLERLGQRMSLEQIDRLKQCRVTLERSSASNSPDKLRKAGWTILDMEYIGSNAVSYLIGK